MRSTISGFVEVIYSTFGYNVNNFREKMTQLIFEWLLFVFFFSACTGLYEDQIGKFEWRQQYIGKLKFAYLDAVSPIKKVIIATEQNVVSALSLKSGDIIWRQSLESDENGSIRLLSVDKEVITISGISSPLIRGWDLERGYLLWEWGLTAINEFTKWISIGQKLIQIDFNLSSHIIATMFYYPSGRKLKSQIIPTPWLKPENCIVQNNVVACLSTDKLLYSIRISDKIDELDVKVHHKSLLDLFEGELTGGLKVTQGKLPIVSVNVGNIDRAVLLEPEIQVINSGEEERKIFGTTIVDQQNMLTSVNLEKEYLCITTRTFDGEILPDLSKKMNYPETHGAPEFGLIFCQPRKDRGVACRVLISTSHDVIFLIQHPGNILWTREESLSSISTVEMVNLPVSDTDAAIEKEFDNKNSFPDFGISCSFIGMFFRRIISQFLQLENLFLTVVGLTGKSTSNGINAMIQDEFGLHKLIIAATKTGKVFGIDNLSGKVVWQIKIENVQPLSAGTAMPIMPLYLLRNARHYPLPAESVLLVKDKFTDKTVLVVFNPITGTLGRVIHLPYKVKQSLLHHLADENFIKPIILMDEDNNVHIHPEISKPLVLSNPSSTYIFTADAFSGVVEGFTLSLSTKENLISTKTWQVCLGSQIIAVVVKNSNEKVHSQGRVLGDRSVLYKYVNPNLVAFVTRFHHPSYKTVINLHLIDVVTGNLIYSSTHRRVKEPVHVIHSENWVVYTYFNEKNRRTELAALEMYEGKTQSNATVFSSIESSVMLPILEKQAYILPANVLSLKETITEKGITSKHILVALSTGGILQLPWAYIDPRRPMTVTPEMREEGVIPYMPELPTPLEAIINHNQTVFNIRGIHTSSSGLESTCLVFAYGLDIFYTRVAPSKTFDLLKEDFDYYLLILVVLALTVTSYVTKKLASRKALKQAWK